MSSSRSPSRSSRSAVSSIPFSSVKTSAANSGTKTVGGAVSQSADREVVETGLPLDIWYFIAHDHLLENPSTIAALCLTCRHLNCLLGPLKYRAVSITLTCATQYAKTNSNSPAEVFAEKLRSHQEFADHLELLRIHQEGDGELQAFTAPSSPEQTSLCYILTRPYPLLRTLALSMKYIPVVPPRVLSAFRACLCLPSLSDISFFDLIPSDLLYELQPQNHTLNLIGYLPPPKHLSLLPSFDKKCNPRTLRIAHEHTSRSLFFFKQHPMLGLDRLTTLALKSSANHLPVDITDFFAPCSPTLTTLEILFSHGCDEHGDPDALVLLLGNYDFLKTLTLKFESLNGTPKTIYQGLEWTIETLSTFIGIEPPPRLESLGYDLFIGDLHSENQWADKVNALSWGNFQTLFSPDWVYLRWPNLRQIFVDIKVPTRGRCGLGFSDMDLIERLLRSKLADLVQSGHLKLSVTDSSMGIPFDEWCRL